MKYKTAVIGLGFIGVAHVEALRRLGNVDVVAICDPNDIINKGKKLYIEHTYSDYKKMIEQEDLDFVHICTPNNTHYEIAAYALHKGINVVVEKPMTLDIEEAEKLVALAEVKDLICAVNFHNRLYPAAIQLKTLIEQQEIGDVITIHGNYIQDWLLFNTDYSWRLHKAESGPTRAVADIGLHLLDFIEYISGLKITKVFADLHTVYPVRLKANGPTETFSNKKADSYEEIPIDTEDQASVLFKFENGAVGNVFISQMAAGYKNNIDVVVSGTKASLTWHLGSHENITVGYRDQANKVIPKDQMMMPAASSYIDYPSGHTEGFADAFKQVFKNVYNNKQDTFFATAKDGLRMMRLNEAIYQSAQKQTWITVEEV